MSLQVATAISKRWLIEKLRNYCNEDLSFLDSPTVNEQNLIFALQARKINVKERFFAEFADELGVPFIQGGDLEENSELAATLPYKVLVENLALPLDVSDGRMKIATANPLNEGFLTMLEELFHAKVELCVTSIAGIEHAAGKGYREIHKHRALRDLRYRNPDESAYRVLYPWQKRLIVGLSLFLAVLFVVNYPLSFVVVFATINVIYFFVSPIKFYISFRGFRGSRRSVRVSDKDLKELDEESLPIYTILIPIYHEAKILSHIIENVYKIDYPHEKLDVKILMEEKDSETINEAKRLGLFGNPRTVIAPITAVKLSRTKPSRMNRLEPRMRVIDGDANTVGALESVKATGGGNSGVVLTVKCNGGEIVEIPESFVDSADDVVLLKGKLDELMTQYLDALKVFDAVVVPDAEIRTKPRACNYGLQRAKGKYCVIYDAEDDPDPDQLKKAAVAFSRAGEDVVCLQSRLNFYNSKENLLTRWFSLEYSFWYDYYLDGLDHVGAPLPLGGTSNHFRTKQLREIGGWDPYNVTEDADLGVRISRKRLKTAMLNSYTFEEANNKLGNWIRQRSRWSKGYVQTYLVHMRHPRKLLREMGWKQFFYFQLTFGGNIFLPLVNPLLWAVTALTLLNPGMFDFLFFYPIVYVCIFNLIIGNGVFILLHMGPYVMKKNYTSIPLAFIIPLYWVLISIGDWRGVIQLVTKPFYWEKTQHGLSHLHGKIQA
jgi:cellulose synthase/poly-beta-1,6-N-acetylglucosamine synthase-like glycosyltransferase